MADAIFKEFRLFCPICNDSFTQLVVLHKLPKGFNLDPYLMDMVERHDHKAFQDAKTQRSQVDAGQQNQKK